MENNTLCNRHSLGVNNHTKMYVTYTRIYGWSDYGGESSYQPGYRLENMMWMTLLVYDYIIPGENNMEHIARKDAFELLNPKRNSIDVYTSVGYMLRIDCWEAEKNLKTTPGSDCALNALAIDDPLEYARLYLDGNLQMWVDAEDSLDIF